MSGIKIENKFVVFNGTMASGKTTQARLFAKETGAELLLGEESKHPDIISGEIYTQGSDIKVEKWFVNFHLGKLALYNCIPKQGVVSDMCMTSNLIYGRALLSGSELEEFEEYYRQKNKNIPKPDHSLLFLLPPEVLLERVRSRMAVEPERKFESDTSIEYLEKIQNSFIESQHELAKKVSIIDLRKNHSLSIDEVHRKILDEVSGF
jgi:thymidylate kinase